MDDTPEEFLYLNRLRESGVVNMFGASPYLMEEFGHPHRLASKMVTEWIEWLNEDPDDVGDSRL